MRALKAEVKGGRVYVDGAIVEDAVMLCEGKSNSAGYFIIDKDEYFYLTKTTQDLTAALDKLISLIDALSSGFVDAVAQGSPPYKPTFLTNLETLKNDIDTLKAKQA
jgi:hypothetical protein